jgi:hypothetical protein
VDNSKGVGRKTLKFKKNVLLMMNLLIPWQFFSPFCMKSVPVDLFMSTSKRNDIFVDSLVNDGGPRRVLESSIALT